MPETYGLPPGAVDFINDVQLAASIRAGFTDDDSPNTRYGHSLKNCTPDEVRGALLRARLRGHDGD